MARRSISKLDKLMDDILRTEHAERALEDELTGFKEPPKPKRPSLVSTLPFPDYDEFGMERRPTAQPKPTQQSLNVPRMWNIWRHDAAL